MQPLWTEATFEEKNKRMYGPKPSNGSLKTRSYSRKFGTTHQGTSAFTQTAEETGKSLLGKGHWVTDICDNRNFELETDKAVVTRCPTRSSDSVITESN